MDRYDRQRRVHVIGDDGQQKLNRATILIAGVGALGSYVAEQLTRAGVAHLILVDPDIVAETNLQRQALFTEQDVIDKSFKVTAAKQHLAAINHTTTIDAIPFELSPKRLAQHDFDLVIDCLDNYTARIMLNNAAYAHHFTYIFGSCAGTFGHVMAIDPTDHPCLECALPNVNALRKHDCDLIGVVTPLVPLIAGLQVSLALHYLVAPSTLDFERFYTLDNWTLSFDHYHVSKNPDCPCCSNPPREQQQSTQQPTISVLCGTDTYSGYLETPVKLKSATTLLSKIGAIQTFKNFVHINLGIITASYFVNGRILIYGPHSLDEATTIFSRLQEQLLAATEDS